MAWLTVEGDTWERYTAFADTHTLLGPPTVVNYLFRGLGDAMWTLRPTLTRATWGVPIDRYIEVEAVCLQEFKSQAYMHLPPVFLKDDDLLTWWTVMQHYRAPTRLLDWTASHYVALYFAVQEKELWKTDGAVWCFQPYRLNVDMSTLYPDHVPPGKLTDNVIRIPNDWLKVAFSPPRIYSFAREVNTDRMNAQQGQFTVCLQPLKDQDEIIDEVLQDRGGGTYVKFIIPAKRKPEYLQRLRNMNIAAHSLFPGIDGVGMSVAEMARMARMEWDRPQLPDWVADLLKRDRAARETARKERASGTPPNEEGAVPR